jgi:preprotein translocase subunit YajC
MDPAQIVLLAGLLLAFWLLVLRPASRRQKAMAELQAGLEVGQRVMLASGLFGTITSLTDERAFVEVAAGVDVEVMRAAVTSIETTDVSAVESSDDA